MPQTNNAQSETIPSTAGGTTLPIVGEGTAGTWDWSERIAKYDQYLPDVFPVLDLFVQQVRAGQITHPTTQVLANFLTKNMGADTMLGTGLVSSANAGGIGARSGT